MTARIGNIGLRPVLDCDDGRVGGRVGMFEVDHGTDVDCDPTIDCLRVTGSAEAGRDVDSQLTSFPRLTAAEAAAIAWLFADEPVEL